MVVVDAGLAAVANFRQVRREVAAQCCLDWNFFESVDFLRVL